MGREQKRNKSKRSPKRCRLQKKTRVLFSEHGEETWVRRRRRSGISLSFRTYFFMSNVEERAVV